MSIRFHGVQEPGEASQIIGSLHGAALHVEDGADRVVDGVVVAGVRAEDAAGRGVVAEQRQAGRVVEPQLVVLLVRPAARSHVSKDPIDPSDKERGYTLEYRLDGVIPDVVFTL